MAQVVWIARHGNRQDFVDPQWARTAARPFDPGLSEDGHEQAARLADRLAGEGLTRIFASPFLRCIQTAHPVAEAAGLPLSLEWGICEWLNPSWFEAAPDIRIEDLQSLFPRMDLAYESWMEPIFPETSEEAFLRAGDTVRRLAAKYEGNLLFVGHGISVTGGAQGLVRNCPEFDCHLASVVKLVREPSGWTTELLGDVSHLEEAIGADRFA